METRLEWQTNNGVLRAERDGVEYEILQSQKFTDKEDFISGGACFPVAIVGGKRFSLDEARYAELTLEKAQDICQSHASALTCAIEKAKEPLLDALMSIAHTPTFNREYLRKIATEAISKDKL